MRSLVLVLTCLSLPLPCSAATIIVDPNGSGDFTNIQAAIDYSWDGDTVEVRPDTYSEYIKFNGRRITLTSLDPNDHSIVASTIITRTSGETITFNFCEGPDSVITGFTIMGYIAIEGRSAKPTISKNVISGSNYGILRCGGIISGNVISGCGVGVDSRENAIICNNVIIGNTSRGIIMTGATLPPVLPVMVVKNNIIAYNADGLYCAGGYAECHNSYNCFWNNANNFGGVATAGTGDFLRDPLFVVDGYWSDGDWVDGDYHLKSSAGRWTGTGWVFDDVNSPCIDAGDPGDPVGLEPNPNGGRINIGAYGGTPHASKSPSGVVLPICTEYPPGDHNRDCKVDFTDFAILTAHWLDCNLDPPEACWE